MNPRHRINCTGKNNKKLWYIKYIFTVLYHTLQQIELKIWGAHIELQLRKYVT